MKTRISLLSTAVSLFALASATGLAAAEAPVVRKPGSVVLPQSTATLMDAETALRRGDLKAAETAYRAMLNTSDEGQRAQARFGMAVTLLQQGRNTDALKVLDGTVTDASPLGKAVGELRGQTLLQLADEALATKGYNVAEPYLDQYDHLTVQPERARYSRIRSMGAEPATPTPPLKVGVLLPLSGSLKNLGDDFSRALQMGLFEGQNLPGGDVEYNLFDTAAPGGALKAAEEASKQGVNVVVGPLMRADVDTVAPVFRAQGIPVLALSSDRAALGEGVWTLNHLPSDQARLAARYAVAQGRTKLAILTPSTPYGTDTQDAFRTEAEALGAEVVASGFYNSADIDIGASIRDLTKGKKTPEFNAIFVPTPASSLPLVASQLAYYGVTPQNTLLLGTGLWQNASLAGSAGRSVQGAVFAVPPMAKTFNESFQNTYGRAPSPLAALGADAANLLKSLAAEKAHTGGSISQLLLRPEGFYSEDGYFKFQKDGSTDRGLSLMKVADGKFDILTTALKLPAPEIPVDLLPADGGRNWRWW